MTIRGVQMDKPSPMQMDPATLAQHFVNSWIQKNKDFVLAISAPKKTEQMKKRSELLKAAMVIKETYLIIHIVSMSPYPGISPSELHKLFTDVIAILDDIAAGNQPPAMDDITTLHDKIVELTQLGGEEYTEGVSGAMEPIAIAMNVPTNPDNEPLSPDEMIEMMEELQSFISRPVPFTEEEQQQLTSILGDFVAEKLNVQHDDEIYDFVSEAVNECYQLCEIASWWKNHRMMLQNIANEIMLAKMDLE